MTEVQAGNPIESLSLVQKLAKIRNMSDVVIKSKRGFNYSYADVTEILANITSGMKKYRVSLIPKIVPNTAKVTSHTATNTRFDKTGHPYDATTTEMLVTADMIFTWVNDDNPNENIEVSWFVAGSQGDPSQALGSGLTYCTRYFLTSYFQIAQPESDVDAYRSRQKAAEMMEDKTIAEGIITQFDATVKQFLANHPEMTDDVKKFLSRYAKNSNYFAIKEPMLASSLANDFKSKYLEVK